MYICDQNKAFSDVYIQESKQLSIHLYDRNKEFSDVYQYFSGENYIAKKYIDGIKQNNLHFNKIYIKNFALVKETIENKKQCIENLSDFCLFFNIYRIHFIGNLDDEILNYILYRSLFRSIRQFNHVHNIVTCLTVEIDVFKNINVKYCELKNMIVLNLQENGNVSVDFQNASSILFGSNPRCGLSIEIYGKFKKFGGSLESMIVFDWLFIMINEYILERYSSITVKYNMPKDECKRIFESIVSESTGLRFKQNQRTNFNKFSCYFSQDINRLYLNQYLKNKKTDYLIFLKNQKPTDIYIYTLCFLKDIVELINEIEYIKNINIICNDMYNNKEFFDDFYNQLKIELSKEQMVDITIKFIYPSDLKKVSSDLLIYKEYESHIYNKRELTIDVVIEKSEKLPVPSKNDWFTLKNIIITCVLLVVFGFVVWKLYNYNHL